MTAGNPLQLWADVFIYRLSQMFSVLCWTNTVTLLDRPLPDLDRPPTLRPDRSGTRCGPGCRIPPHHYTSELVGCEQMEQLLERRVSDRGAAQMLLAASRLLGSVVGGELQVQQK